MRILYATPAFNKMSRGFLIKNPHLRAKWAKTLRVLEKYVFDVSLKTHKLHGSLKEQYACRISFDHRIVFSFTEKTVTLYGVGSHDDMY